MILDLNRYIEMLKISPKSISPESLKSMPDGRYRCYTSLVVREIKKQQNTMVIYTDSFICRIQDFSLPIFEGDVIMIRNFNKSGNVLSVDGEIMINRKPIKVKITRGKIPLIKGLLTSSDNHMILKINSREFGVLAHNGWREVLIRHLNREIVIRNAIFDGKQFILDSDTEVYVER
ncbi:MAG: hypothetical protein NZ908_01230 [Candidatus Micrarchaeota archaeon]|nr:hypothetical protein [Candidatus Micrarchaeota archaeon]MCX8154260.1 hypothetical protein [Candidatus Micrarchaeota archaeon]